MEEGLLNLKNLSISFCELSANYILHYKDKLDYLINLFNKYQIYPSAVFTFGHFNRYKDRKRILFYHEQLAYCLDILNIKNVILHPGHMSKRKTFAIDNDLIIMIEKIYKRYEFRGIEVGIHPHIGSPVFYKDEIDILMDRLSKEKLQIKLVPDLGHLYEASIDPIKFIYQYHNKISNIHLKNILPISSHFRRGKFSTLTHGVINIPEIMSVLKNIKYEQWITLEIEDKEVTYDILSENYKYLLNYT
ncbi:sugar phosphate isomerase/epimerase [Bacillus sp. 166amftsu]|uniref:sugar phosphate isomerase/epimerase family protein n=1 Tax=Bacillus sp. 166amftsu TaxID=1761753 RepID=UPI000899E029|nr:sugar phosphate isomerase/epimerase [Bacillus sp. 166amftsu]SDZ37848.1 Sugar phosphate isomerase/epimerase [Bacillus sp. 166amftsu]